VRRPASFSGGVPQYSAPLHAVFHWWPECWFSATACCHRRTSTRDRCQSKGGWPRFPPSDITQLLQQLAELIKILQPDNVFVGDFAFLFFLLLIRHAPSLAGYRRVRKVRLC
jgi:hypothetical protein